MQTLPRQPGTFVGALLGALEGSHANTTGGVGGGRVI